MKKPLFEGVCTAMVTPFRNGTVDYATFDQLLERQISSGVQAVLVCGTTGESATLTQPEKIGLISHTVQAVSGRIKVLAGTGSNDTAQTIELSRVASSLGADGLLLVTPYYNKATQKGLAEHFTMVADAVNCPVIVYNVPSRTGVNLTADTYAALSLHPNINGVKEASGDLPKIQRTIAACNGDFHVWSGNDDLIVPTMAVGGKGVISVLSNLRPAETVRMVSQCQLGDYRNAGLAQCQAMPLIDALFSEVNPIPIKAALGLSGLDVGSPRRPLTDLSESAKELLKKALA